ncbi:MAG: membrane protein [Nitrospirales bacterium]|nr:MAG: membrane protein [Nitrospirales bacterium]
MIAKQVFAIVCVIVLLGMAPNPKVPQESHPVDLEVFVRKGCPHCAAAKTFLKQLKGEDPQIRIKIRDLDEDQEALTRLTHLASRLGVKHIGVPTFYIQGELVVGFTSEEVTGQMIRNLLARPPPQSKHDPPDGTCALKNDEPCTSSITHKPTETSEITLPFVGPRSLPDLGLPLFTVLLGLLDGFNPCAMWVLLFLLSLLATLRDRQKMFLIAGTFVVVSGLVYFAFMAAWLNVFLIIGYSRVTQLLLGGIALIIGAINVKDFFAFRKGVSLTIPESAKPGLYTRMRKILQAEHTLGALFGVIVLATLVNMIELVCTAGFPAIYTELLARQDFEWWRYYSYLGLYNLAYIADDVFMVTIAVFTLSHRKLQEREGRWLKLISGVVMIGLGTTLIGSPGWLV